MFCDVSTHLYLILISFRFNHYLLTILSVIENQEFQRKINDLESKIKSKEADVLDLALRLRNAEVILQQALDQSSVLVKQLKDAPLNYKNVTLEEIVSYGFTLSLSNKLGPFPGTDSLRFTRLYHELDKKIPTEISLTDTAPTLATLDTLVDDGIEEFDEEEMVDF